MTCGFNGMVGVARVCPIKADANLTISQREWIVDPDKGSLDVILKGPYAVYLKENEDTSPDTDIAARDGWFKIWDDGYEDSLGEWCTEKVVVDDNHDSISVPEALKEGRYVIRAELLALPTGAGKAAPTNPEFYVSCAQVVLSSDGIYLADDSDTVGVSDHHVAADSPLNESNISTGPGFHTLPDLTVVNTDSSNLNRRHTTVPTPSSDTVLQPLGNSVVVVPMTISLDGHCGHTISGLSTTCFTSHFGDCCNSLNFCGSSVDDCVFGCQSDYGHCYIGVNRRVTPSSPPSSGTDGSGCERVEGGGEGGGGTRKVRVDRGRHERV